METQQTDLPAVGIVKHVPPVILPQEQPAIEGEDKVLPPPPTGTISVEWNGVPLELANFFNVSITQADSKTMDMLRDINIWSKNLPEDTIGDKLQKIRSLESRLGVPSLFESRISKTWNWVKMDFHINELRKRQSAYER